MTQDETERRMLMGALIAFFAGLVVFATVLVIHVWTACDWAREVGHPAAKEFPCRIL